MLPCADRVRSTSSDLGEFRTRPWTDPMSPLFGALFGSPWRTLMSSNQTESTQPKSSGGGDDVAQAYICRSSLCNGNTSSLQVLHQLLLDQYGHHTVRTSDMAVSSTSKEVHAPSFAQEASTYVKPSTKLRQLLAEPGCVPAPGVYDGISARLALEAGFPCLVSRDL